jgi:hypothetical protein
MLAALFSMINDRTILTALGISIAIALGLSVVSMFRRKP